MLTIASPTFISALDAPYLFIEQPKQACQAGVFPMKWYKRDPDAALAGMVELTLEERGAYNTIIDLLYSRDGIIPTDDRVLARACNCRPQTWRRIKDALLTKGKLHMIDGKLMANRVTGELAHARRLMFDAEQNWLLKKGFTRFQRSVSDRKLNEINDRDGIARALQPQSKILLLSESGASPTQKRLVEEGRKPSKTHDRLMIQGLNRKGP